MLGFGEAVMFSVQKEAVNTPPISHIPDKVIIRYISSAAAKTYT